MAGEQGAQVVVSPPPAREDQTNRRRSGLGLLTGSSELGLIVAIVAVLALIYLLDPQRSFFDERSLRTLIHQAARFGVLALGAAVVIIAGGIDLSVGSVVALASVVSAMLTTEWLPALGAGSATANPWVVPAAILLTLALGVLIGLAHAEMINRLRLPPFIATLATMAGLRSLAMILSNNRPKTVNVEAFRALGYDPRWTISIFVACALLAHLFMSRTVLGRHIYALGGNEAAARLSGLDPRRLKRIVYGLAGFLSALGGILFTGQSGQGQATMGVSYELFAITAAVVGGCSLAGGVGSIRGTVLGLILIQCVIKGTGQVIRGIDSTQIEGLVLGLVVVLAVAFNQGVRGRRE
ncbi:MAG: sugar ABC transporter permease [Isosphaeraceae bacterium]|jgi:ribose/xylose/arabinose/galactoside ABC-type transport system permease subunit|nr:MAG: sugar ABC transporter permease [Isosphaeraceae bacterium]